MFRLEIFDPIPEKSATALLLNVITREKFTYRMLKTNTIRGVTFMPSK